jgi:hypothetical protein
MYSWKAKTGSLVLEDKKGALFSAVKLDKLEEFTVLDEQKEVAKVNLLNGKIEILGVVCQKAGLAKKRNLIWIKRNVAQPGSPLKTTYLVGYYAGKEKVCYAISDGTVTKQ